MLAVDVGAELGDALSFAFGMLWEILWALILGFALSAVVQAVVSKKEMRRLLPDDSPKSLVRATGLGAASSSCSYAAVALARSLFRRGADFTASIAFEIASTNLVFELGNRDRAAARLGVRRRRVRRRAADDHARRRRLPALPAAQARRRRARAGEQGARRLDGGARRDGHVGRRRGVVVAAPEDAAWPDRDLRLLRHGLGGDLARHRRSGCSSPARWPPGCPSRGGSRSSWSTTRPRRRCGGR